MQHHDSCICLIEQKEDQGMDIRFKEPSRIFSRSPRGIDPLSWFPVKFLKETDGISLAKVKLEH
jgi:hypothetical protein